MKLIAAILLSFFTLAHASTFIPLPAPNPPSDSLTAKGNLLTSDGSAQVEFPACSDGKVLEYLSTESSGILCGDKTVDTDTNAGTICSAGEYLDGDGTCQAIPVASSGAPTITYSADFNGGGTSASFVQVVGVSTTVGSSGILEVNIVPNAATKAMIINPSSGATCLVRLVYNGSEVYRWENQSPMDQYFSSLPMHAEGLTPGTATLSFQYKGSGGFGCSYVGRLRIKTW